MARRFRIGARVPDIALCVVLTAIGMLAPVAGSASAATVEREGGRVTVSGEILSTTSELFVVEFSAAMLAASEDDPVVVVLDSQGGDARAAHGIADQILSARRHGMEVETRVEEGGICMSACPLIFSAGGERRVSARSMFLFHGITYQGPRSTARVAADLEAEKHAYLARMRTVDPALGGFLERRRIVAENIDAEFDGASLRDIFPGFATGMLTE